MVVRLKHVEYMDSAGVAVLLELIQAARSTNTDILIVEPSPASRRALGMVDIEALVTIYETIEECAECVHATVGTLREHLCTPDELSHAPGAGSHPG
jgi:anti-anti-sigma regulatory factor